jgi:hypothetical protein
VFIKCVNIYAEGTVFLITSDSVVHSYRHNEVVNSTDVSCRRSDSS